MTIGIRTWLQCLQTPRQEWLSWTSYFEIL